MTAAQPVTISEIRLEKMRSQICSIQDNLATLCRLVERIPPGELRLYPRSPGAARLICIQGGKRALAQSQF